MKLGFKRALAVALLVLPAVAMAGSWWNGDWKFRKEISFDLSPTGADVAGSATEVPVLVRLSIGNFSYFGDTKADGGDFRVLADDDKTPLKFHFERYDVDNQMAYLWISVPRLTGGAKTDKVYLYYGNSGATAGADGPGTYDADQALVLHFGGEGLPADVTAYKNNATASTVEPVAASFSGAGIKVNGSESLKVAASSSLSLSASKGYTASVWVKFDGPQSSGTVISLADGAKELTVGVDGVRAAAHFGSATASGNADLAAGQWHHLAATVANGQLTVYADGVAAGSVAVSGADLAATVTVGASAAGRGFAGEIDEVGVSKVARSADWVRAVAHAQNPEGNLVVYGGDGQKEGGGSGYIGTIAKNLTPDGWFVIVICLSMLAIAIVIMVMKAFYLSRVESANAKFLAVYRALREDVTSIGADTRAPDGTNGPSDHATSTLYQLYATGTEELFKRILHTDHLEGKGQTISAQAVEAIRASMDATQVRSQQSLSARMVLLTIAISGGPYLGLLGTVIGVMITFAAIAASGDVNVNAIAPGTAAALAATVAGLLVAIPCLFGYNWLNTRIKSITSDNRVFTDEFVARIAEQFS